jgi:tetratricopeptide (TPR) repeat protein
MGVFMAWNRLVLKRCLARFGFAATVCLFASSGARTAWAAADINKSEAKARFATGQSHYNLNEYSEALREFKEAYRLYPDPVFLYNAGQCERQLGHPEEAIRFYRSFLREQPKAPNRQEVQNKISELEDALKNKPAEPPPSLPLEPAKPVTTPVEPAVAPGPPMPTPATATTSAAPPTAAPLPATPPVSPESAGGTPAQVDLSATPGPAPETGPTPIYKRWWLWTAAAVVVVGAGVGIYAATAGGGASVPSSALGSNKVF